MDINQWLDQTTDAHSDQYARGMVPSHRQLVISNEGIGDFITQIKHTLQGRDKHGVKSTDKKPGAQLTHDEYWSKESEAAIAKLKVFLDKYYLNDNWLKGRRFREPQYPINAKDFSPALVIDGKIGDHPLKNPDIAIQRIKAFTAAYVPNVVKLSNSVGAINQRVVKATKGADEDDQAAVELVKKAIVEMNALPDPLKQLPRFQGTSCGNLTPYIKPSTYNGVKEYALAAMAQPAPVGVDKLPALSKEQIKEAAQLIKDIFTPEGRFDISAMVPWMKGWLDHSDGSDFNDWIYEADNSAFTDYYEKFDYHQGPRTYLEGLYDLFDEFQIVRALERWIDRSIID